MKDEFKFEEPTKVRDAPWVYAEVLKQNDPYKTTRPSIEKKITTFPWLQKLKGRGLSLCGRDGYFDLEKNKFIKSEDYSTIPPTPNGFVGLCIRGNAIEIYFDKKRRTLKLSRENIDKVAASLEILRGKWLIFKTAGEIDNAWKLIWESVRNGILGDFAKCSTSRSKRKKHVICVYTPNYLCKSDVMRVRKRLRELGFGEILYYKPDIYTDLGIYSGTKNLPAHYYRN